MKYLCLVYLDQEHWSACPDPVCAAYGRQLADSKRLLAAEPLHPVHTATTVRVRNGQVQLTDPLPRPRSCWPASIWWMPGT